MKSILRIADLAHYNNGNHIEFHKTSYSICFNYREIINSTELISAYNSKVLQEDHVYRWMRKSDFTAKKIEANRARSNAFFGMSGIVTSNLRHCNSSIRDNAAHVKNLLRNYSNMTTADYDSKTANIDSLIARLNSPNYLPAVQNLGLESWITELTNQNNLFKNYVADAIQEQVTKPNINTTNARRETDNVYRSIITRVTSFIDLNGPDNYIAFVDDINVTVIHYNTLVKEHYGRLHAKINITDGTIAPVDVQPYTGKPVYVIPTVSIVKTAKNGSKTVVELIFSEDYIISYKNNIEPGTATLIITGTGKYTGEIVTTFNISNLNK